MTKLAPNRGTLSEFRNIQYVVRQIRAGKISVRKVRSLDNTIVNFCERQIRGVQISVA